MAASFAMGLQAIPSPEFDSKLLETKTLLRKALTAHVKITQASSLGAEDVLVTHLLESLKPDLHHTADVFVLNTGQLHVETLALLASSQAQSSLIWRIFEPAQEKALTYVKTYGALAMRQSLELRKTCCHIRKVEPLSRALVGYSAWITGMRSEQSVARTQVSSEDVSDANITKYNPLVDWTWGDVLHYITTNNVPYNALHDQFYPSIGCEPCTRAISIGEDFRAGRWWWENEGGTSEKECGLHVSQNTEVNP